MTVGKYRNRFLIPLRFNRNDSRIIIEWGENERRRSRRSFSPPSPQGGASHSERSEESLSPYQNIKKLDNVVITCFRHLKDTTTCRN